MTTDIVMNGGHTFIPSLQNISLKRFRLRYCSYADCYYLHWDEKVCPQLSKINGLRNGVFSSSGVQRCYDEKNEEGFVSCEEGSDSGHIEWRIDFSSCGLVIMNAQIRVSTSSQSEEAHPAGLTYLVKGNDILLSPELGNDLMEFPELVGCSKLSLTANVQPYPYANDPIQFLIGNKTLGSSFEIHIDLMCPRPKEEVYCGEILLGVKFGPEVNTHPNDVPNCTENGVVVDCHPHEGQLQVHVVEGARLVDEDTNKPYKTVVKCNLVPNVGRFSSKQTSPRHNAYPTWTENFIFNGVTKEELVNGGLEVMLYDHHHFSGNHSIGGLRMCVPRKKEDMYHSNSQSPETNSPDFTRSYSPIPNINSQLSVPDSNSPSPVSESALDLQRSADHSGRYPLSRTGKAKSLPPYQSPNGLGDSRSAENSPIALRRKGSPVFPNTLSPRMGLSKPELSDHSPSGSPRNSPISLAKSFFRLSGSHLKHSLSPHSSPRLSRKKYPSQSEEDKESEFVHWWMEDVTSGESNHWRQVLEKEREWIYFWHCIRYKLKAT